MNIKSQVYRGGHFIDILPARPLRPNGIQLNFTLRNTDLMRYSKQNFVSLSKIIIILSQPLGILSTRIPSKQPLNNE